MVDVQLRSVRVDDLELLLAWRSNPEIYEQFREQEGPLTWEEHLTWFATRPSGRQDFVIEYNGHRVGSVAVTEESRVSIYVGETALWGEGIATAVLDEITRRYERLSAVIHHENEASQRLFERCGFEPEGGDEWIMYLYES